MGSYENAPTTTYLKGESVVHGYDAIKSIYAASFANSIGSLGQLSLKVLEVRPLGPNYALCTGKFALVFPTTPASTAGGIFTLVFHHSGAGWKIASDHTSSRTADLVCARKRSGRHSVKSNVAGERENKPQSDVFYSRERRSFCFSRQSIIIGTKFMPLMKKPTELILSNLTDTPPEDFINFRYLNRSDVHAAREPSKPHCRTV